MIQTRVQLLIFFFVQTPLLRHYSTCFTCNDLRSPLDYHSILIQSILSIKYMHFCFNPELHSHIFWPGTEKWFPFKQLAASRVVSSSSSRAPQVVGDAEDGRTLSLNRRWTTAAPSEYRSWWYVGRDPSTDLWQQKKITTKITSTFFCIKKLSRDFIGSATHHWLVEKTLVPLLLTNHKPNQNLFNYAFPRLSYLLSVSEFLLAAWDIFLCSDWLFRLFWFWLHIRKRKSYLSFPAHAQLGWVCFRRHCSTWTPQYQQGETRPRRIHQLTK